MHNRTKSNEKERPKPQYRAKRARGARTPLFLEERRSRIKELIGSRDRATVQELAARFGVSAVTIRSDLDALARDGGLIRSHGGAVRREEAVDMPLALKQELHRAEKNRIAHAAAQLIRDGETIILDSGTTTAAIAATIESLHLRSLTVITNALNVATALAPLPHVRLIMIGGMLRQVSSSLVGPQAEQVLRGLHADRLFLGVDSLDPEIGLMTPDILEAQLNALMIEVSQEVVAVADASKFGRRSVSVIAGVDRIHKLITDASASPEIVEALRARGVAVTLV